MAEPVAAIVIPFSPVLAQLGPISVRWYGLAYAVAFIAGLYFVRPYLLSRGVSKRDFDRVSFWAIVVGLLGARLYYVVQSGALYYATHPQHILAFWEGGMAYFGAVLAVVAFLFLAGRRRRLPFWVLADGAALFAAVGQPIGRIGNLFNGDVLGYPSSLPWAIVYTDPHTYAPRVGVAYQPANLYELLIAAGIGLVVVIASRRGLRAGAVFLLYIALYAVAQFAIFFVRAQPVIALGLKQAQWTSLAILVVLPLLVLLWRRGMARGDGSSRPSARASGGRPAPES